MSLSIVFALASMFCAGVNDLIFKKYVLKVRSKGIYLSLIGVVWALIFYAVSLSSGGLKFETNTVIYSIICGALSITAQIFLLESLRRIDVSIGSTIYRLNFVVVVILSPIFLGELLTPLKFIGSLLAIISVLLLSKNNSNQKTHHLYRFSLLYLLIIASILRGMMGFFYKVALNHDIDINTFLFLNPVLWIIGGFIYAGFFERDLSINKKVIIYSGISGLLVTGIVLFLLLAVKNGEAITAVPIAQLSFIITGILSIWFLREKMTSLKVIGICFAIGTILCLSFSSL